MMRLFIWWTGLTFVQRLAVKMIGTTTAILALAAVLVGTGVR